MELAQQHLDDWLNRQVAEDRLDQAPAEIGRPDQPIGRQRVETPEQAERVAFGGSRAARPLLQSLNSEWRWSDEADRNSE